MSARVCVTEPRCSHWWDGLLRVSSSALSGGKGLGLSETSLATGFNASNQRYGGRGGYAVLASVLQTLASQAGIFTSSAVLALSGGQF